MEARLKTGSIPEYTTNELRELLVRVRRTIWGRFTLGQIGAEKLPRSITSHNPFGDSAFEQVQFWLSGGDE
jgi:hypothetical protein